MGNHPLGDQRADADIGFLGHPGNMRGQDQIRHRISVISTDDRLAARNCGGSGGEGHFGDTGAVRAHGGF